MPDVISLAAILLFLKIIGGATTLMGLLFGVFRVINWIKTKFTSIDNNVVHLKNAMDANFKDLRDDVKNQTTTIATALSEQRQDFRTFFAPSLLMTQQHYIAQTATATARAKSAAKTTTKPKRKKLTKV